MKSIIVNILMTVLFCFLTAQVSAGSLKVSSDKNSYPLLPTLSLFEDAEGTLNAEDVWRMDENKWQKPLSYNQNLGYNSSVFWLKLKLKNLESKAQKRLLFAKSSYLETTDLYLMNLDGGLKVHHSGSLIPMSQRHFPHRTPTFVISLAAESETDILIKINSTTSVQLNFTLENIPSFHQTKSSENIFLGVFYGVLFGIASYNLFLFLFIRDITYLYYSIYQICILLFGTAGDGNILYLVPDSAWSTAVFRNTVIAVGYIAGALFVRKFLDTPKNFPFIDNIMKTLMVLFIPQLMIPFVPITWTTSFYQYGTILGFILISLALVLGVLALIKKVRMARYFLLGWFMLLIGANFFILSTYGFFQDYLISMRGFQIGAMLESILLSLALADRVRQSQRDRQSSQMKVVEAQQQALENLHKTDELKNQILASTSHELRTPLHGIIGLVEAVQEESQNNLPHWARENLQLILNNGHRLNHLINDLLDSSALRQGQIVLQKEVVSLNFSVAAVLRLATSLTLGKEVKLINEVSSSLPPVEVDPSRFQQILLNLLNNAIKYSGEGNIVVTAVSLGEQVIVSVIDKGPGIPDEQSEHIFNAFEKGTVQSASFQEGIGLGLSICQQLVKAHGGKIWLEPTSVGATFCFSLQALPNYKILTDQPHQQSQITNHPPEVAGTAFPKQNKQETSNKLIDGNILIVDDDQVNLHVLMGYLGQENFWITACNNAEDALNMIEKDESFDLVLLDVMMPDMDGFEICEIIREKHSESELPILLLTALDSREDITHGYEAGANDYLCKPFQKNVLMSRLLAHLHLSERWIKRQGKTRVSKNEVLIDLLQSSLNYWQSDLNKTMLELAQESGWGVYMEKHSGTWRSRGFEKYLNLQTIPKNPRWRKVLQTAQYVMEQLPMGSTSHNELKSKLNRLMEVWKS